MTATASCNIFTWFRSSAGIGIASQLLALLADWFTGQDASRICVDVEPDNATARAFYARHGAVELSAYWMVWTDVKAVLGERWAPSLGGGGQLNGTTHFKEPLACTEGERREFARLVRQGFDGSDEGLDGRIRDAKWLAFHYAAGDTLAAIAALKVPSGQYRDDVFRRADAPVSPADYKLELGWVFVVPSHRGRRIAESLCQLLLARVATSRVFATTRPNNIPMISILLALGFARAGKPYRRRDEELVLFLRALPRR